MKAPGPSAQTVRRVTTRPTTPLLHVSLVDGDLLDQADADALVNPWNRNFVPRALLLPQGVSGALKRRTGPQPWRQLARYGLLGVGQAVLTDGGRLPQHLIHVAGLHVHWRASRRSVELSARNAVRLAWEAGFDVVAMPLIGAGTGGLSPDEAIACMRAALQDWTSTEPVPKAAALMQVRLVRWSGR